MAHQANRQSNMATRAIELIGNRIVRVGQIMQLLQLLLDHANIRRNVQRISRHAYSFRPSRMVNGDRRAVCPISIRAAIAITSESTVWIRRGHLDTHIKAGGFDPGAMAYTLHLRERVRGRVRVAEFLIFFPRDA